MNKKTVFIAKAKRCKKMGFTKVINATKVATNVAV